MLKHRLKKVASLCDLVSVYRGPQAAIAAQETGSAGDLGLIDLVVYGLHSLDENRDGYA